MIVKSLGNNELTKLLEDSIKGEGENIYFSKGDIEKDRIHYIKFFEESYKRERIERGKSRITASKIYITI